MGCAKPWIRKPRSSWETLNFHISFWELQAYVLLHDEVIDFSLYICWSVSEFQATTIVPELKRISVKMLLHNYWTDMIPESKDCCRQSLWECREKGLCMLRERHFLCKLPEQTMLSLERHWASIQVVVYIFSSLHGHWKKCKDKKQRWVQGVKNQARKVVIIFWETDWTNKASEKGTTVMNALPIPKMSETVPSVLIKNWYYLLVSLWKQYQ